jgi:DNA polymerase-4
MWGVGKMTQKALGRLKVFTFRDLSLVPVDILEENFGKHGLTMHLLSMGLDERAVVPDHKMKSMGHEETYSHDITDLGSVKKELLFLANKVARRLRRKSTAGKTVTLKVKYADFVQKTRSATLPEPTDDGPEIYKTACDLLQKTEAGQRPLRLLGISLSQLILTGKESQLSLFDQDGVAPKRKDLNTALDAVYEKHGDKSIGPGTLLNR